MPELETTLHLDMFRKSLRKRRLTTRIKKAVKVLFAKNDLYGIEWGDPETAPPLRYVKEHFLTPYLSPDTTVVEIGPGGGRWTRYMLKAKHIYAVDYHQELLNELASDFDRPNITFIKNNGDDFPDIKEGSIDFIFSFGAFVHLDIDIIDRYLQNMKPLLNRKSNVVIHYSDKTKPLGAKNEGFSENDPDKMRALVLSHGYSIYEEDVKTMWHSAIVRFGLPDSTT